MFNNMNEFKAKYEQSRKTAQQNGICERTFRYRLGKGWSFEDASTLPLYTRVCKNVRGKNVRGPKEDVIQYRTKKKEWVY